MSMRDRLAALPRSQIDEIRARMEPIPMVAWPRVAGCLVLLFTARSGSTFLSRELECQFDVGFMRESLNPPPFTGKTADEAIRGRKDRWFAVKAGVPGVICGELNGFFSAYLAKSCFLLLGRRDIVAQAVSRVKADQTGKWHAGDRQVGEAVYDGERIATNVRRLAESYGQLRAWLVATRRPWRGVVYESFAHGEFDGLLGACQSAGAPRLSEEKRRHAVEKVGDETNRGWIERFQSEMPEEIAELIDDYHANLSNTAVEAPAVR